MKEESPVIEEPEKKPAEKETAPVDIDALTNLLEQFDAKNPQKLEGKLRNANDYANMQSQRDQFANELAALRQEITSSRVKHDPIDDYSEGKPIDIEDVVAKSVERVLTKREQAAMQHQQRMNQQWLKITGHKKYNLVKEEFEQALKDPATVMQLQTGQLDAMEFYHDMVTEKALSIARQAMDGYKQVKGASGVKPPHIESNAQAPHSREPDNKSDRDKKLEALRAKRDKTPMGLQHEDEIDAFLDKSLFGG